MKGRVALLALLAGCSNSAWQLSAGTPHVHSNLHVHTSGGVAALLGLGILAAGAYQVSSETSAPPEMSPDRKISEQDCSKPIDYTLGNIRCK